MNKAVRAECAAHQGVQLLVIRAKLSENAKTLYFYNNNSIIIMAPITRRAAREKTPPNQRHVGEYDTIEKGRFFNVYDREHGKKSISMIVIKSGTTESIAKRWLYDRRLNGRDIHRYMCKRLKVLGYKSRVMKEQC
jgi:hypothetical protein